jgi:transcriptional regulator with XRE-family HTH domain
MQDSTPSPEPGRRLRADRLRVRLSTRDVERLSQKIAKEKNNSEYCVSHTWLTDIENGQFTPSIYKLYSLSLIYERSYDEILSFFGISIRDTGKGHMSLAFPRTHLVAPTLAEFGQTVSAPIELRQKVRFEQTNLVSKMFERWGEVPISLLRRMNPQNTLCGYIGLEDFTLFPIIRPGSFVQIDPRQTKIDAAGWQSELDRPIYFVELRDDYVCSWCQLDRGNLTLIPCPQSRAQVRQVRYPTDAEILGRVTAVTMRIADVGNDTCDSFR